ncbi:MAG: hypothetical protein LBR39_00975, partial [Coriobacteriales bacterium]|nr:hypothetical protein [Coriobacteriales bacterium]
SIAYGVFCAAASIDRQQALAAFTFSQASASVNVCVKSVPLSQTAGQRLLVNLHPLFDTLVTGVEQLDERMLWASTPALDIAAMRHERLYSRLYMS